MPIIYESNNARCLSVCSSPIDVIKKTLFQTLCNANIYARARVRARARARARDDMSPSTRASTWLVYSLFIAHTPILHSLLSNLMVSIQFAQYLCPLGKVFFVLLLTLSILDVFLSI